MVSRSRDSVRRRKNSVALQVQSRSTGPVRKSGAHPLHQILNRKDTVVVIERSLTVQGGGTSVKAEMELMSKSDQGFCSNLNRQPPQRKTRRQSTKPPHSNDARSFSVPATNVPMNGVGLEIARTPRPLNCKGLVCVCVSYPINTLLCQQASSATV